MSELQATCEFSIELAKFYNVDLFQRGFYQIRVDLQSGSRQSCKTEVTLPRNSNESGSHTTIPASIINGVAVSKTFQILYRNEEIVLDDVIHYRVHTVVDSAKIQETIDATDFEIELSLWFSEDGFGMEQHESLHCVSTRSLKLHFVSSRGIHYCLPVLFGYFHLSAVILTVHGVLVSIHQPYLPSPKPGTKRGKQRNSMSNISTMETVLFGQGHLSIKYGTVRTRLAIAATIYKEVCLLLLQALEGLQRTVDHLGYLLPGSDKPTINLVDVKARLSRLTKALDNMDNEDDFLQKANSDISQLCAENILQWNKFLDTFTLVQPVRQHLAEIHHNHRLRRFAEGFFTMRNPRKSLLCCLDAKHHQHLTISDSVRKSEYFQNLPNLEVYCKEIDGSPSTLPVIFEDTYSDGIPKRNTSCDTIALYSGCLLVPSGGNPQLNGSQKEEESAGNKKSSSSSKHKSSKSDNNSNHLNKKKISLPDKFLRGSGRPREMNSVEFMEKYAVVRKTSLDSMSSSHPAPTPSSESSGGHRFSFRSKNKEKSVDREVGQPNELPSGYSHLDCCSRVPFNLQEEPEETELETPREEKQSLSGTYTVPCNIKPRNRLESKLSMESEDNKSLSSASNHYNSSSSSPTSVNGVSAYRRFEIKSTSCLEANLSSHGDKKDSQKKRQVRKQHSFDGPGYKAPAYSSNFQDPGRASCYQDHSSSSNQHNHCKTEGSNGSADRNHMPFAEDGSVGTSRLRKYLNGNGGTVNDLDSPSLVLDKTSRSRSEEPRKRNMKNPSLPAQGGQSATSSGSRPRHQSESISLRTDDLHQWSDEISLRKQRSGSESCSRGATMWQRNSGGQHQPLHDRRSLPFDDTTCTKGHDESSNYQEHHQNFNSGLNSHPNYLEKDRRHGTERRQVDANISPPVQFRDTSKFNKTSSLKLKRESLHDKENNSSDPLALSFLRPELSRMSLTCSLTSNHMNNEDTFLDFSRISRSNTSPHIAKGESGWFKADNDSIPEGGEVAGRGEYGGGWDGTISLAQKPATDSRRRKKHNIDATLLSHRLSSSLQFIDRTERDAIHVTNAQHGEDDILENRPVAVKTTLALESSNLGFTCCDWLPNHLSTQNSNLLKKIEYLIGCNAINFVRAREKFKQTFGFPGALYSDFQSRYSIPYFSQAPDVYSSTSHLVVCVHGLDGNSADLRLVKTYLEIALPSANLDFLMSEVNQSDTFLSLDDMSAKLVDEIIYFINNFSKTITKISFIGHSLGCILIRTAITRPELAKHAMKFYTFLSLSGPHLGTLYNSSGLVNAGLWMIQKWKKAGSLQQISLKDAGDIRNTFLYKLALKSNLQLFKHVLLAGSSQDKYVPIHSARIELCKAAVKDNSVTGSAYREMVNNILMPLVNSDTELVRYDIHHALPASTNSLIGRAAHIAVLDSELFIEKFLVIAALKYFK